MQKFKQYTTKHLALAHRDDPSCSASRWRSADLDPVPKADKKWEWYHIGGFWIAEGFSAAQIQTSSAAVALGLNSGLALAAYAIGNLIAAVPCSGMGYIGSKYSINFPVVARASFGMWGSFLAIIVRLVTGPIWYGIQSYLGGLAIQVMIQAIWPSFITWHEDALPASADITASALLGFAIFWLVSLPFLYIRPPKLRWLFIAKIVTMPFLWMALFTWALTASDGFGPLLSIPSRPQNGMSTGYLFCYAITASISGVNCMELVNLTIPRRALLIYCIAFTVNMPDITRYAHDLRSSTLAQAIGLPVCLTMSKSIPRRVIPWQQNT
ncbi:MAG: hypothetical protein Q9210_003049 [Variospora velana]